MLGMRNIVVSEVFKQFNML